MAVMRKNKTEEQKWMKKWTLRKKQREKIAESWYYGVKLKWRFLQVEMTNR